MSTMVVQERHLLLNLVEMKDVDKAHFLDTPISQAGLFGDTVEGFAQQFSAVQQQTEAVQHTCPGMMHHPPLPRGQASVCPSPWAPSCVLQSCSAPGRIDTLAGASSLSQESGAPRVPARPQVVQEVDEAALTWATGDVGICSFSGDSENSAAPSPGGGPGGESSVSVPPGILFRPPFLFRLPTFSRKSNFLFLRVLRSLGWQCATPCFLTLAHDPFCQ